MDRLADTLKNTLQPVPPAMGFKPAAVERKPHMLLVVGLNAPIPGETWDPLAADVLLFYFNSSPTAKILKQAARQAGQKPWGMFIQPDGKAVQQAAKAGADFVVFDPNVMDISPLEYTDLGKVLLVDEEMDDMVLKAGSELPCTALILEHRQEFISWRDLMYFRKLAGIAAKPVLLAVSPDITQKGLQALWESGIDGVILSTGDDAELSHVRQLIDSASFAERGKGTKARPVIPMLSGQISPPPDEREHEDDGEEYE